MRYVNIVLFFFLLHVSISIINAADIYVIDKTPQDEWLSNVNDDQLKDSEYIEADLNSDNDFGFGDFVKGLFYFVKAVGWGIISVPYTLGIFGLRSPFIYYLSAPIYFLYFLAIAQYIRGMQVEK